MRENKFQSKLIEDIKKRFPGCIVMKNDSSYIQGIPDLTVLIGDKWATLECKRSKKAKRQPNQEYYVERMNDMSFSRFIYPENKEDVLNELESALRVKKQTRSAKSKLATVVELHGRQNEDRVVEHACKRKRNTATRPCSKIDKFQDKVTEEKTDS